MTQPAGLAGDSISLNQKRLLLGAGTQAACGRDAAPRTPLASTGPRWLWRCVLPAARSHPRAAQRSLVREMRTVGNPRGCPGGSAVVPRQTHEGPLPSEAQGSVSPGDAEYLPNRSIGHRAGSQCRGTMTSLCGKKTCSCSQPRRPTHVGAHPCAELGPSSTRGPEGGRGSPGLDCTGECSTLTPSSQPRRPRAQRSLHPPHPNPTPSGLHGPSPHLQGGWVAPQQEHPHGGQGSGPTPTALQR